MSQTTSAALMPATALPGARIVARIRRLIVVALVATLGYAAFMTGSKGYCAGGVSPDGGFIDADGTPTDTATSCITLNLRPSILAYAAIIAIVLGVLTKMLRRATDEACAVRYLDKAAAAIAIIAVASLVISQIWFLLIPITDWDGTGTFFFPFPFGSVDVAIDTLVAG